MNAIPPIALPEQASARANSLQREASDPTVSAFVAASAGSGKTKLLVDRLLRLMLEGADPGRILCLTYTKAAAAEMALRLQRILGEWVTLDEAALIEALKQRGITPEPDVTVRARALFARVLDLPGGMRISTIHAFCQSLLRRFPLEAAVAPHFRLMEEQDSHAELQAAREAAIEGADPAALRTIAGLVRDGEFGRLLAELRPHLQRLEPLLGLPAPARLLRLQRALGVAGDDASLLAAAVAAPDAAVREAVRRLGSVATDGERSTAARLQGWLGLPSGLRQEHWGEWVAILLKDDGEPRQICKGKRSKADPGLAEAFLAEAERVAAVEDARRALLVAEATNAVLTLAAPVFARLQRRKQLAGLMDYGDLISHTRQLLIDPGAAWVLYKLDGGLDHVLLDEVQDSAPEQWAIAGALTAEFFAGTAAERGKRTVFAVGDRKQSIYSFQGAEPAAFDQWRERMRASATASGGAFRSTVLDVSFRSTTPVLALVDAVFADPVAAGGVLPPGETLQHQAHRAGHAGQVELWPLTPRPQEDMPEPWAVARRNHGLTTAPQLLADTLAQWVADAIGRTKLPSAGRMIAAGDILILVRRRGDFARAVVRRLKALGVPVAGLDRLFLTDQPAVQDLLALCDTLLLPQDDLALACVLTSPLGGLSDDDLMQLAIGREVSLWGALRARAAERPEWQRVATFLQALMARVDYASPHALLVEALGPLGGRARLLRRLGPEAAEPIDELLGAALAHAGSHPPSLQGFLHWLRQSGAEVKREAEAAGHAVRVMTVHGAKGLQAPVVILPDTTALPPDGGGLVWAENDIPLWSPFHALRCRAVTELREAVKQRQLEEYNRLLYVALTRAEDRLVVCGWQTHKDVHEKSWYAAVQRGMTRLPAVEESGFPIYATAQAAAPAKAAGRHPDDPVPLPPWAGLPPDWVPHPPPAEPARPRPLAPSRPADAVLGPVPRVASPLTGGGGALDRGSLVHRLLQHAPDLPATARPAAIESYLRAAGAPASLAGEVLAILDHPALQPLFGPLGRAEQPLSGLVGDAVISGQVDRLAVLPDSVIVADYKTNRDAPDAPELVPVLYLRQMAAYRAVLQQVFPNRVIQCSLVWTRTATVMVLPGTLLDVHGPAA